MLVFTVLNAKAPSEAALLRDLLFVLQGVDGQCIAYARDRDAYEVHSSV